MTSPFTESAPTSVLRSRAVPVRGLSFVGPLLCACLGLPAIVSAQTVEFNRDVRPILAESCFPCHGPDIGQRKAGLRLDTAEGAYAERKGRAAIVPGDADASELIHRVTHGDAGERMPPAKSGKTLSDDDIELLRSWIEKGAPYEVHWSFVAPRRRPVPEVGKPDACNGFIDRWILKRLEEEELTRSPPADPITLVRRLHFDLIGLPPTPEAVVAFQKGTAPDAYEKLVDDLLASPRFGERLAMYWLDLVRFADTVGYHGDQVHPIAPYRDWVIAAFNDNMPFDQFTIEQLAGDLLPSPTVEQKIATGYNRLLQTTHEGGAQAKEYLAIYAADRVRNLGSVWMGATTGCAQCHDHKYDPYTTRDFYSLAAFFADIDEKGDFQGSPNSSPTTRPPEMVLLAPEQQEQIDRIDTALETLRARPETDPAEVKRLLEDRRKVQKQGQRTMITVSVKPRITRVLPRGDWLDDSGEVVEPETPGCLDFLQLRATSGRRHTRLDLARWLVSADHPQTARVLVNRLWHLFFGKGISSRLDDLGVQGEWPVHPELLDALALELVESGWDLKHMVKLIVKSHTYRQSSLMTAELLRRDPQNRLLARQSRWRLPAEMVRDNALAVSGLLVNQVGGDSVRPYQPAGYYRHLNFPTRRYEHHRDHRQWRRGVYMHWQRMFLHPALRAFDAPTREECTAERPVSNTPQAALTLLNDPTFVEAARVFATRVLQEAGAGVDDAGRLGRAFRLALNRAPHEAERTLLGELLDKHRREYRGDPEAAARLLSVGLAPASEGIEPVELAAWTSIARTLLNLNEAITRN